MCTKNQLFTITDAIALKAKDIFSDSLDSVILYGSYARGEETAESDIDILILVNKSAQELSAYKKSFSLLSSELGLEYDILVSVTLKDSETFYRYINAVPFYSNVSKEGIKIAV